MSEYSYEVVGASSPPQYRIFDENDDRIATCFCLDNARLVVSALNDQQRIANLERVAKLAAMIQGEDYYAMREELSNAGWHRMDDAVGNGWHHPANWPYPDNRTIGTESACMMELDLALNEINGG